jgi:peroxiredoxin
MLSHIAAVKTRILVILSALIFSLSPQSEFGAETNDVAQTNSVQAEFKSIIDRVQAKLSEHKHTPGDFADELKAFDGLLARHPGEKTEDLAQVAFMRAQLYLQVFQDEAKARELFAEVKRDYPDSQIIPVVNQREAEMAEMAHFFEARKINDALQPGTIFPDFDVKDLNGKPLSISNYKGKVVLIDFWATWCPPCVAFMPEVQKVYEKYHADGFEIIGISLDDNQAALKNFLEKKDIPWPQFFDGKHWQNQLAVKYGIVEVPQAFLLDGDGKIIARDLIGPPLEDAVAKAVAKK